MMEAHGISMCGTRTLHVFLHLVCILHGTLSLYFPSSSIGELKPDDPRVFFGDQLVLTCSLTETTDYNSSHLYFTYGQDMNVSSESVTIISDKVAILNETVTNMADFSGVMYNCWARKTLVASQVITVEYRPRQVRDFRCIVHNWDNMQCDWELGDYVYLDEVNVKVAWTSTGAKQWFVCNDLNKTSCFWNNTEFTGMKQFLINVTVSVNMDELSVANSMFNISTNSLVKPSKVYNVVAVTKNSTCIFLKWSHSQVSRGLVYRINYTNGAMLNTAAADIRLQNYTACNLSPFTAYTFYVETRPLGPGFWSDVAEISNNTFDDVPTVGPNVTSGSYTHLEQSCVNGKRRVILFFKEPRKEHQNGVLTKYKLKIKNRKTHHVDSLFVDADENTALLELKCNTIYDVKIFALTRVGPSKTSSDISIYTYAAAKSPRQFRIESDTALQAVIAKWDSPPDDEHTRNVTVYWCRGSKAFPSFCKNGYDWTEVKENTSVQIPVSLVDVDTHMFAISRDTSAGSSGMQWSDCRYVSNQRPDVPDDVHVAKTNPDLALNVLWNGKWCDSTSKSLLSKYIIYFNQVGSSEANQSVTVDSFASNYQIDNLEKVNYSIWMQAKSDTGKLGPVSKPVFAVPVDNRLSEGEIAGIVAGGLFALVFIVSGIIFLCRKCKGWMRKDNIALPSATKNMFSKDKYSNMNGVIQPTFPGDLIKSQPANGTTFNGVVGVTSPDDSVVTSDGKSHKGPDTSLVIDRQTSTVSTDSGRGSMRDSHKNGDTSPLSVGSNCFEALKEEEEESDKMSNDTGSTALSMPSDYSRFANVESSNNSTKQATVGFLLADANSTFTPPKVMKQNNSSAAQVPEPLCGNSVESYVTVGGDNNDEVQRLEQNKNSFVQDSSSNSVEPYVTVGGDGNNAIQFVKKSRDSCTPFTNQLPGSEIHQFVKTSQDSLTPFTNQLPGSEIHQEYVQGTELSSDQHTVPSNLPNINTSPCVENTNPSEPPYVDTHFSPSVEKSDPPNVQNSASNEIQKTDPPYVDTNFSSSVEKSDPPDVQNSAANEIQKTDPPYVDSNFSPSVEKADPPDIQNSASNEIQKTDPPYVDSNFSPCAEKPDPSEVRNLGCNMIQRTDPPYVDSMDPPYVGSMDPPYVDSIDPPYVGSMDPPYVGSMDPPYVGSMDPPYVGSIDPPYVGSMDPPYVDSNVSLCVEKSDPSEVQNPASNEIQKTDPPHVDSNFHSSEITDPPSIKNTESFIQTEDPPYV